MLQPIAEGIWGYERDVRAQVGMLLPARATLMRCTGGALVLHAPLAIDEALARDIAKLGEVTHLIAPSCLHWMSLAAAHARYPKARVYAAPGLEQKLGDVPFAPLGESGAVDGMADLTVQHIAGVPMLNEHVFLHRPSRSLVVTDLLFNVHRCAHLWTRTVLRTISAWQKSAQSFEWRLLVRDRTALARSVEQMLAWDFTRIVLAHGDIIDDDARGQAERLLAWVTRR
jgi:hypothetical protein